MAKKEKRGSNPNSRKNLMTRTFERGNLLGLRHGGYSSRQINPLAEVKEKEILDLLDQAPYISSVDMILISSLAKLLARMQLFEYDLEERSNFVNGKLNPSLDPFLRIINQVKKHCEELGLTPASRARLGVDLAKYKDIAERLAERAKK